MSSYRRDLPTPYEANEVEASQQDNMDASDRDLIEIDNLAILDLRVSTPQDSYKQLTSRDDVREILTRLARQ